VNVIDAKLIFQLASEGDMMCAHLVEVAADYLGFACVNFCRIFDPQVSEKESMIVY
jgi:predicted NBD/HSP70 family sugar kinase